jgi:tRNA uridine 5-carbamoylmethylation protein Kti12
MAMVISPDAYLQDPVTGLYNWTEERVAWAWEEAYKNLRRMINSCSKMVIMCGLPGAGKSTWVESQSNSNTRYTDDGYELPSRVLYFDATFTTREARKRAILDSALWSSGYPFRIEAIVIDTPLDVCLHRNSLRREDRRVPESSILRMAKQLAEQPPRLREGFDRIQVIRPW